MESRSPATVVLACIAAMLFWTNFCVFVGDRMRDDPVIACTVGARALVEIRIEREARAEERAVRAVTLPYVHEAERSESTSGG